MAPALPPPITGGVLKALGKKGAVTAGSGNGHGGGHAAAGGLVPTQFEQFHDRAFWDNFFKERGMQAFEWYGTFRELWPFVAKALPEATGKGSRLLVVGCGNSDFSRSLYLEGGCHQVVNVDFSVPVIAEMRAKTAALCPDMQWLVQDVTALAMEDGTVDAVIDKGTLDAIFSTPANEPQADKMLDEVDRVLSRRHGRYLVVTLGQNFILRKLLQRFGAGGHSGWRLDLYAVEPQPGSASPFLTLVGIASGPSQAVAAAAAADRGEAAASACITLHFDASARRLVKEPLHFGPDGHGEVMALVAMAQERHAVKQELQAIEPGRFKGDIDIWLEQQPPKTPEEGAGEAADHAKGPRYTLSIVDIIPPTPTPMPCAVLLIPQGREHEWLFATADGLRQVAESADYQRLVCVRMNRGHRFTDMEEVKAELGPVVMDFVPADCDPSYMVPYLAVGDSIGSRNVIASGSLPECGEYCVEEEDDDEGRGGPGAVLRRLVFLRNQHVIQSEIRLVPPKQQAKGRSKGKGSKGKKGGKGRGGGGRDKSAAAGGNDADADSEPPPPQPLAVDWSYLCFDYHRAILAGLIGLLYPRLRAALREPASAATSTPKPRCLVIGLGGGGLPLFLRRYVPCLDVTVVELEGGLAAVAEAWFGFRPDEGLRVEAGDGVARVVEDGEGEAWDAIVVDVDNKDASQGISCPAPAFLAPGFLAACRARLTQEGVLAMNVAARSSEMLDGALEALAQAFAEDGQGGELLEVRPTEQDVNRVIFALREPRPAAAAAKTSLGLLTERWLEETAAGGPQSGRSPVGGSAGAEDPLELGDISRRIRKRA